MRLALTGVLFLVTTMLLTAQERDRAKVPDSFKWNLADIYPSDAAWRPTCRVTSTDRCSSSGRGRT